MLPTIKQLVFMAPSVGSKFLCPTEDDMREVQAALKEAGKSAVVVLSERVETVVYRVAQGSQDGTTAIREDGDTGGVENPAPLGTTPSGQPKRRPQVGTVTPAAGKASGGVNGK